MILDFFAAFKTRMYQIKEEMKILKEKASKDRLEMKREERMASLQSERDWFRKEALGINFHHLSKNLLKYLIFYNLLIKEYHLQV